MNSIDIVIWGAGAYSRLCFDYIDKVNRAYDNDLFIVKHIVDSDILKQGQRYRNWIIEDPEILKVMEKNTCVVVAVKNGEEICERLRGEGIGYYSFIEFTQEDFGFMPLYPTFIQRRMKYNLYIGRGYTLDELISDIGLFESVACVYERCGRNIEGANRLNKPVKMKNNRVKTLALYYKRMYNGGIERVISHLIYTYIEGGYRVILLNDKDRTRDDYNISDKAIRYFLTPYKEDARAFFEEISTVIEKEEVDILFSHSSYDPINYYLGMLLNELGVYFSTVIHNVYSASNCTEAYHRQLHKYTDLLISISQYDRDYWLSLGYKCVYIPNPVIRPSEDISERRSSAPKEILWIGRIDSIQKRVYDTVDFMKELIGLGHPHILNIVGTADDSEVIAELNRRIEKSGVNETIRLCGFDKDVSKHYKSSSVMIMTSAFEGFGMVLAEARSYGLPIVMYDLPYLELIKDGKGVVFVNQGDTHQMALEVIKILDDDIYRSRLSIEARESIKRFQDIDILSEWNNAFKML